jgi:hypothetical protein
VRIKQRVLLARVSVTQTLKRIPKVSGHVAWGEMSKLNHGAVTNTQLS